MYQIRLVCLFSFRVRARKVENLIYFPSPKGSNQISSILNHLIGTMPWKQIKIAMFGLFKKKSELEKLQEKYQKLMKEAFDLSKTNRKASDDKYAEADEIQKKIAALS